MARLRRETHSATMLDDRVGRAGVADDRVDAVSTRPVRPLGDGGAHKGAADPIREEDAAGEVGVGLDAAIDAMLAAGGVDPITQVRLTEARRAIGMGGRAGDPAGFEGTSLSRSLYRFVMPRLRHPEVLRADRHYALLESLIAGLGRTDQDGVVREGALIVQREIRRLAQLRSARNALIEG